MPISRFFQSVADHRGRLAEELDPDAVGVLDVYLRPLGYSGGDGGLRSRADEFLVRLLYIVDDEREMVQLLPPLIAGEEPTALRVPVQFEPLRGTTTLQMDVPPAMGHRSPTNNSHSENTAVERQGSFEVAHPDSGVVESKLHAKAIVSTRERLRPAEWR